ncbi:unnamed protein product [Periconia digitata]|uniref:Uncharacterized protein n=1 Tax=Periconia digitata TaxID=1303443 RepID=A0A9W4URX6_9PLEO|nr:unnamed protein product [Periconia digitata]
MLTHTSWTGHGYPSIVVSVVDRHAVVPNSTMRCSTSVVPWTNAGDGVGVYPPDLLSGLAALSMSMYRVPLPRLICLLPRSSPGAGRRTG